MGSILSIVPIAFSARRMESSNTAPWASAKRKQTILENRLNFDILDPHGTNEFPNQRSPHMSMYIGEALVGDGNEIAHIDLLIGSKDGPVGAAFANALANQSAGHSNLLALVAPNLMCKPATVMITKVTIKGAKQAVQMFGPA